jgi:hypothetical protein
METITLFDLDRLLTKDLLERVRRAEKQPSWRTVAFEGYPTAMLLRPCEEDSGSFHYMFFPATAAQRFHYHPSVRYLLIASDVPVEVQHSSAATDTDPRPASQWTTLPPYSLNVARIPTHHWHRFVTEDETGTGAVAFSIHGDDGIPLDAISDDLMTEVTIFFKQ